MAFFKIPSFLNKAYKYVDTYRERQLEAADKAILETMKGKVLCIEVTDIYGPKDAVIFGNKLRAIVHHETLIGRTRAYIDIQQCNWFDKKKARTGKVSDTEIEVSYFFYRVTNIQLRYEEWNKPWSNGLRWRHVIVTADVNRIKYKTEKEMRP